MRAGRERGQASVELIGLVLLVSMALTAAAALSPLFDPRPFGGFLAHHFVCAATGRCQAPEQALARAYGDDTAAAVRAHAPNLVFEPGERELPVDWRHCRHQGCSSVPDDPALDTHLGTGSALGGRARATAFTRVIRRDGRLYLQYWSSLHIHVSSIRRLHPRLAHR